MREKGGGHLLVLAFLLITSLTSTLLYIPPPHPQPRQDILIKVVVKTRWPAAASDLRSAKALTNVHHLVCFMNVFSLNYLAEYIHHPRGDVPTLRRYETLLGVIFAAAKRGVGRVDVNARITSLLYC